jgi:hypothetical protein
MGLRRKVAVEMGNVLSVGVSELQNSRSDGLKPSGVRLFRTRRPPKQQTCSEKKVNLSTKACIITDV